MSPRESSIESNAWAAGTSSPSWSSFWLRPASLSHGGRRRGGRRPQQRRLGLHPRSQKPVRHGSRRHGGAYDRVRRTALAGAAVPQAVWGRSMGVHRIRAGHDVDRHRVHIPAGPALRRDRLRGLRGPAGHRLPRLCPLIGDLHDRCAHVRAHDAVPAAGNEMAPGRWRASHAHRVPGRRPSRGQHPRVRPGGTRRDPGRRVGSEPASGAGLARRCVDHPGRRSGRRRSTCRGPSRGTARPRRWTPGD